MIQLVDQTQFIFAMYNGLQWTLSLSDIYGIDFWLWLFIGVAQLLVAQ